MPTNIIIYKNIIGDDENYNSKHENIMWKIQT